MPCPQLSSRWARLLHVAISLSMLRFAATSSLIGRASRSGHDRNEAPVQTMLAAELGSTGRLRELKHTQRGIVRRQLQDEAPPPDEALGSAPEIFIAPDEAPDEVPDEAPDPGAGDADESNPDEVLAPQPNHSYPAIVWKSDKESKQKLKWLLTCPGEYIKKENFSKPNMCSSAHKMKHCRWDEYSEEVAGVCGDDCFCEAVAVREKLDMQMCKDMCSKHEPCTFTFTANKGCRVYSTCNTSEIPESDAAVLQNTHQSLPHDWVTCERFFDKFYDKSIALHNTHQNRFMMIDMMYKGSAVTNTVNEVKKDDMHKISASMRFTILNTSDVASLNKGAEDPQKLAEEEAEDHEQKEEIEADGAQPEEVRERSPDLDSPGRIALYNNIRGDGSPWMRMNNATRRHLTGTDTIGKSAIFTVCYLGPNEIALHNKEENRYVMMDNLGVTATEEHDCCTIPDKWFFARFTVVSPPPLTGREDDSNDKFNNIEMEEEALYKKKKEKEALAKKLDLPEGEDS